MEKKGAYQFGHDRGIERYGFPHNHLLGPQLQHPANATLDLIVRQILRRRTVRVHEAVVHPHRLHPLRQWHDLAMIEGVEHPHPIKAMLYKLLELLLDDPHLMLLLMGATPQPTILLLRPPAGERRERRRRWIPDIKPLPMPPPDGVAGEVRGI